MANASDNYGLILPVDGEFIEINDLNYNFEKIDNVMWDNRRISVAMYNTARTYNTGSLAGHEDANGHIHAYRCLADNVTGTWDATKWTLTDLASEIEDIRENAGTDVEANPSGTATDTLEKLMVDSTIYAIPEDVVSKEVSGNPVEFTDGASAPLVKCVTQITGSQDLHGYDKPWVGGAGKNKIPVLLSEVKSNNTDGTWNGDTYSYSGVTFKVDSNSEGYVTKITVNASPSSSAFSFYLRRTATVYTDNMILNGCPSGGGDSTYDLRVRGGYRDTGSGATIPANTSFSDFWIVIRSDITVSNLVFQPMIRLSTVTDPTFTPYSNICPITAYTEGEIEVRGKNLFDYTQGQNISAWQNGTNIIFSPSDARIVALGGKAKNGETYTFSFPSGIKIATMFYYENDTLPLNQGSGGIVGTIISVENASGAYTFTATETNYVYFYFAPTQGQTTLPISTLSTAQMEKGTTSTTYEPYTSTTHTTTYPSAIYRGSEDCVSGEVVTEWKAVDLGSLTWTRYGNPTAYGELYYTEDLISEIAHGSQTAIYTICSCYESVPNSQNEPKGSTNEFRNGCIRVRTDGRIYVRDDRETTLSDFTTAVTGQTLAYELATPTTSSVTPTNLPIKSLSGYNHIESSTGDMEVEYIISKYQPLVNLMKNMVVANPSEDATATLEKLKVNDTVYSLPSGGGGNTVLAQSLNTLTVTEV